MGAMPDDPAAPELSTWAAGGSSVPASDISGGADPEEQELELLTKRVQELAEVGQAWVVQGNYAQAVLCYERALGLLPPPAEQWPATLWLLTAIGEAHFLGGAYAEAAPLFARALRLPGAQGNPYIHLRLGQCLFELARPDAAAAQLSLAYLGDGGQVFEGEDEKYLAFTRDLLLLP